MNWPSVFLLLVFPTVVLLAGLAFHAYVNGDRGGLMERRGRRT